VGNLKLEGTRQSQTLPNLIECNYRDNLHFIDFKYEYKPLDKSCDHKFVFLSRSLECLYDSTTILNLVNLLMIHENYFKGKPLALVVAKKRAGVTYSFLKLIHESKQTFDIHIDIMSNIVIIPQRGVYLPYQTNAIVVSLGKALITLKPRHALQMEDMEVIQKMKTAHQKLLKAAYNTIEMKLSQTQVIYFNNLMNFE